MTYKHSVCNIQTLPEHFFFDFIYGLNDMSEKFCTFAIP